VTGSPEVLGGRVKTLHPAIHAGILARDLEGDRLDLALHGWEPFDLVAVNLYPFQQTVARLGVLLEEAIEDIDIGGVALLRAAAKNYTRVTVVCSPGDYTRVLDQIERQGHVAPELRRELAVKAFAHTAEYDAAIYAYLSASDQPPAGRAPLALTLYPVQPLR
jgi:phosphoribosylaminoimidazolecarboxamide formyltransferase/IMP cyclohydrolase